MRDVALPALAHGPMHTGAGGSGGLIATLAAGALAGTLVAGHTSRLRRPAIAASAAFLVKALAMAVEAGLRLLTPGRVTP